MKSTVSITIRLSNEEYFQVAKVAKDNFYSQREVLLVGVKALKEGLTLSTTEIKE